MRRVKYFGKRYPVLNLADPLFNNLMVSGHALPGVWRYMLPKEFARLKLPRERLATCDNCPMVAIGAYTAECRCCSHFAQIPNFQLGLALKDPRSRERTRAIIQKGYALPEGIDITPTHFVSTVAAYKDGLFGRSRDLLCAFADADSGNCGIYPYRSAICATYHCGHDHCDAGAAYWDEIEDFVGQVETALSQWAMGKAGIEVDAYIERRNCLAGRMASLSGENSKSWSKEVRARLFGDFFGREEAFFEACADHVASHRDQLWQIASKQPIQNADEYDRAVDNLVAGAQPEEINTFSKSKVEPTSLSRLWRLLTTATDNLWKLPFNVGTVVLSEQIVVEDNPKNDPVSRLYESKPFRLICRTKGETDDEDETAEVFLTTAERDVLRFFEVPRTISQSLFDRPELSAIDNPKDFLAECLRCGILSHHGYSMVSK